MMVQDYYIWDNKKLSHGILIEFLKLYIYISVQYMAIG
jgi:hypothetical protein